MKVKKTKMGTGKIFNIVYVVHFGSRRRAKNIERNSKLLSISRLARSIPTSNLMIVNKFVRIVRDVDGCG